MKTELERFFLNATFLTDKDARIVGWRDAAAAEALVRSNLGKGGAGEANRAAKRPTADF